MTMKTEKRRGYVHVHPDRTTRPVLVWAGTFNGVPVAFTILGGHGDGMEEATVATVAADKAPGLYRAEVTTGPAPGGLLFKVRLGRVVKAGVAGEIATLERLSRRAKHRRGKPGAKRRATSPARLAAARHARTLLDALRRTVLPRTQPKPAPEVMP